MYKKLLYLIFIISLHPTSYGQDSWISRAFVFFEGNSQPATYKNELKNKSSMKEKLEVIYKIKNYRARVKEFGSIARQLQRYVTRQEKHTFQNARKQEENKLLYQLCSKFTLKYKKLYETSQSISVSTPLVTLLQNLKDEITSCRKDKTIKKLKLSEYKAIRRIIKISSQNLLKLEKKIENALRIEAQKKSPLRSK